MARGGDGVRFGLVTGEDEGMASQGGRKWSRPSLALPGPRWRRGREAAGHVPNCGEPVRPDGAVA